MPARLWSVLWVSTVAVALAAQDQPQRPIFKTEANYIRVDVFPTRDGAPVDDLTQDDFEVFEDNVPQKIDAFEHVVVRAAGPQQTLREPNTVAESRAMLAEAHARVFVVYLDVYHVDVTGSHNVRQPLVTALNEIIGQDDLVGVMTPEMSATDVTFARRTTTIEGMLARNWPWGERNSVIKWKSGGDADVTLLSPNGSSVATAHARVEPGSRSFRVALAPAEPLAPGEYAIRVRARGSGGAASNDTVRFALPAAPAGSGAVLFRRGPSTGNKDIVTADPRFRRGEQIRAEIPLGAAASTSARLLDKTGIPLAVPVTSGARDETDGTRWQTAQLALAPLAPADHLIELTNGSSRTLVAFRVVP